MKDKTNCCSEPQVRLRGFDLRDKVEFCECDNCGAGFYEPEIGQAVWGNPHSEYDFDEMPDSWIVKDMINLINHYSDGEMGFNNEVFEIRPYYWGDDDQEAQKPNFYHYASGLEIRWYKYVGRGMSCNQHVCPQCFWNIFADCMNSLMK